MATAATTEGYVNGEQKKVSKRIKMGVMSGVLAGTLCIAGVAAYLTDTESVTNNLNLDTNFAITLTEPSFVADDAKDLAPTQTVAKDPTITNSGTVDGYVAVQVKVPVFDGKMINAEGKIATVTDQDLFTYTVNTGWTQVGEPTVKDGFRTYTYVYSDVLSGAETATVFDDVTVVNLAEGIATTDTTIDIVAYGIQSQGFTSATDAYNAYVAQAAAGVEVGD